MDWKQSDVVSSLALLVSLGSLYVSWRAQRRAAKSERPIFWVDRPYNSASEGDWHHVVVHIRNRRQHAIQCEKIEVRRPRRAVIAPLSKGTKFVEGKGSRKEPNLSASTFTRSAVMSLHAAHSGKDMDRLMHVHMMGTGDASEEQFLIHCPPPSEFWRRSSSRAIRVSMRITWRSKDESSRRQTSVVYTELMPAIVIAVKAT